MIVVSFGIMQSGSTLAFEMTKAILELNGHPQRDLGDLLEPDRGVNFVRHWSDELLGQLLDASRDDWIAIKTHRMTSALSREVVLHAIDRGEVKVQVVYRDPCSTVAAMIDLAVRSYHMPNAKTFRPTVQSAINRLGEHLSALRAWGSLPSLKLCYDDFAFHPTFGPQVIAADLGLEVDPADVWRMVDGRFTQRNVARPHRHVTDLWPSEVAAVEEAFPMFLALVRDHDLEWFVSP